MTMTQATIAQRRLINQGVAQPRFETAAEAVHWLGAVQAQDYLGSLWAIGRRMRAATERSVEQAIAERSIVRTWPMRGTIHFIHAEDARWMLELLAPRVTQRTKSRLAQLELDEATIAASANIITKALGGGKQLSRNALYEALEAANIVTANSRGLHILGRLAHDQLVCFAAREGKQPAFALFDEWLPNARSLPRDEALARLTLRYFTGHGPATMQDLMWWSGLTTAEVKVGLTGVESHLMKETIDGKSYYFAENHHATEFDPNEAMLLPPFDEYLVAYRDRSASLDPAHNTLVVPGGNGIFNPIVVIDGEVVGTWKRVVKPKSVQLSFKPFTSFDVSQQSALAAAAERYGAFLESPVVLA